MHRVRLFQVFQSIPGNGRKRHMEKNVKLRHMLESAHKVVAVGKGLKGFSFLFPPIAKGGNLWRGSCLKEVPMTGLTCHEKEGAGSFKFNFKGPEICSKLIYLMKRNRKHWIWCC